MNLLLLPIVIFSLCDDIVDFFTTLNASWEPTEPLLISLISQSAKQQTLYNPNQANFRGH